MFLATTDLKDSWAYVFNLYRRINRLHPIPVLYHHCVLTLECVRFERFRIHRRVMIEHCLRDACTSLTQFIFNFFKLGLKLSVVTNSIALLTIADTNWLAALKICSLVKRSKQSRGHYLLHIVTKLRRSILYWYTSCKFTVEVMSLSILRGTIRCLTW